MLLGRPEATHVAKLGAWQYEHAVIGLGHRRIPEPEQEHTLRGLADLMLELLGADLCRVAVHDLEMRAWKSGPLSGRWWDGSRKEMNIPDTDEHSATVKAAKDGRPVIIDDVQIAGRSMPPNDWVHGCVALPLVRKGESCNTVLTLWHHVADWFSQFDDSLLESLAAIGGARVHFMQKIELQKAQEEKQSIQTVASHIGHTIKNRLPERGFRELADKAGELAKQLESISGEQRQSARQCAELAAQCANYVKAVHSMRRRFQRLARMEKFRADAPRSAEQLFSRIREVLAANSSACNVAVKSCRLEPFSDSVICNLESLEDDIFELMTNSARHNPTSAEHPVSVSLSFRLADNADLKHSSHLATLQETRRFSVVEFEDDGAGIPIGEHVKVFEEPGGTRKREEVAGSLGLGLPLARALARKLGGDMIADGERTNGARFLLFLPITS